VLSVVVVTDPSCNLRNLLLRGEKAKDEREGEMKDGRKAGVGSGGRE